MDPETLEQSWRQHASGVRKLVRELLGDAAAADDVVQQTWLTALRRPPAPTWNLGAWLAGVARNHARDQLRGEERRAAREHKVARTESTAATERVDQLEQIELVVEAVRRLSARNREIVLLRYYEDLPPAVIAERLALPVATVKTRLRRSLAELRRRLEGRVHFSTLWIGGSMVTVKSKSAVAAMVAAVLLMIGGTWHVLREFDQQPAPTPADSNLMLGSPTDSSPMASVTSSTHRAEVPATHDTTVDPAASSNAGATGILVRVASRATGLPVGGATVSFLAPQRWAADPNRNERELLVDVDPESQFAPYEDRLQADDLGEVRLPPAIESAWIHARHGELWGRALLGATSPLPLTIELDPERQLRIRVVGADGAPRAGVAVGLRKRFGTRPGHCFVSGVTTLPNGAWELRHFDRFNYMWDGSGRIGASFEFPLRSAPFVEIDPAASLPSSLELHLPPTGAVRIRVLDEASAPLPLAAFVGLAADGSQLDDSHWSQGFQWTELTQGEAFFPHVGLGVELTARLRILGGTHELSEQRFQGPAREGETVETVLHVGARARAVVGRFVDENGAPLRDLYVQFCPIGRRAPFGSKGASSFHHLRVDSDGRFGWVPDAHLLEADDKRFDLVSTWRTDGTDPRRMWTGVLDLRGRAIIAGENEIGDIVLRSSPPLAAGRTVDENGASLPAEVRVERWADRGRGFTWSRDYFEPHARVQRSGEFSVYGSCEPGELRLLAEREGYQLAEPVPFTPGESGLTLVLRAAATIEGHVLLDEDVPSKSLQVRVSGSAIPSGRFQKTLLLDENGGFRIGDLGSGSALLRICTAPESGEFGAPPESEDIYRIEDLKLRAGETCPDSRLHAIDLRGRLRALRLSVADQEALPLGEVEILFRVSARPDLRWQRTTTTSNGRATLVAPPLPLEVHLGKSGYAMLTLESVEHSRDVVLARGSTIAFQLDERCRDLVGDVQLRLSVHGTEKRRWNASDAVSNEEMQRIRVTQRRTLGLPKSVTTGTELRHEFVLPGPGEYVAELELDAGKTRDGMSLMSLVASRRFTIDASTSNAPPLRIELDEGQPEKARQTLEKLREAMDRNR